MPHLEIIRAAVQHGIPIDALRYRKKAAVTFSLYNTTLQLIQKKKKCMVTDYL